MEDLDDAPVDGNDAETNDETLAADEPVAVARPSVLAVVVAYHPGSWFAESMAALAAQDYPRLQVLVVVTGGGEELAAIVREHLPSATIRTTDDRGFGIAANRVLEDAPRAALLLVCHDDVALAPDALSHLVREVVGSNAAVVGPKLVEWDDPTRLQHVGLTVDKFGVSARLSDEGEIDQAQHDAVSDVFAIPSACMLVRTDLFRTIGGFDDQMTFRNDDVDFCWRAQLAGARVMVVPDAVARHREGLADRRLVDDAQRLHIRHAIRSMLSCWSLGRLVRIVPQALVLTAVEMVWAILHGRFRRARELFGGWLWNLRRLGQIAGRRKTIATYREVDDADVHALQVRGSARMRQYLRGYVGNDNDGTSSLASASKQLASSLRAASTRQAVAGFGLLAIVVLVGSRRFFTNPIPAIGELQPLDGGTGDLLRAWWHGWHPQLLGTTAAAPTAYGLLGLLGLPLFGHASLLRTLLVIAPLPLGAFGMWRLTRPFGSRLGDFAGVAVYLAVPVGMNGYAHGSLSVLTLYAAAPWLLASFARLVGTAPFGPGARGGSFLHRVLGLGLLLALASALVPFVVAVAMVMMLGLLVGALVSGDGRGIGALFAGTLGAVAVAFVLHLPWSLTFVRARATWATFAGAREPTDVTTTTAELLRFHTGPHGASALAYAVLAVAAFALFLARGVRLTWAVRGWFVAVASWALLWVAQQGWLSRSLPNPGVVLAPAAAGLALAAALGVAAFETDLRRHRFGWRQFAPFVAVFAFLALLLPLVGASFDGAWKMPKRDFARSSAGLVSRPEQGAARILWIGDPDVMPLAGVELGVGALDDAAAGLSFATTDGRTPNLLDRWSTPGTIGSDLVRGALTRAMTGDTNRLGRQLALFGVRYIVLVDHLAPAPLASLVRPVQPAVLRTFSAQLDLERVDGVNEALQIYRNLAWVPTRAALGSGTDLTPEDPVAAANAVAAKPATPALLDEFGVSASRGPLRSDTTLYHAVNASANWRLRVENRDAPRRDVYGWANAFAIDTAGDATLDYHTPRSRRIVLLGQVGVWLLVLARWNALRERVRRGSR